MLTLDACLAVGGWFSSDGSDTLGSGLLVEVLVPKVHSGPTMNLQKTLCIICYSSIIVNTHWLQRACPVGAAGVLLGSSRKLSHDHSLSTKD